jgi:hypothetical protein
MVAARLLGAFFRSPSTTYALTGAAGAMAYRGAMMVSAKRSGHVFAKGEVGRTMGRAFVEGSVVGLGYHAGEAVSGALLRRTLGNRAMTTKAAEYATFSSGFGATYAADHLRTKMLPRVEQVVSARARQSKAGLSIASRKIRDQSEAVRKGWATRRRNNT